MPILLALSVLCAAASPSPPPTPVIVYDDGPRSGFADATWFNHILAQGNVVHGGGAAMSLYMHARDVFTLRRRTPLRLAGLAALQLWVRAGGHGGQQADIALERADGRVHRVALEKYLPHAALLPRWQRAWVPLAALGGDNQAIVAVHVINRGDRAMQELFVDDVAFVPPPTGAGWLHVAKARIVDGDGAVWAGRGASAHDTRACGACLTTPSRAEAMRRIDELIERWGANFVRLPLESYGHSALLDDPAYVEDLRAIVAGIGAHPGVHVMLALWYEPTLSPTRVPTAATAAVLRTLVALFHDAPHVLFAVASEPAANDDGRDDAAVWAAMNAAVATIREAEAELDAPPHVVVVPGTGGWGHSIQYYVEHPIAAGGGAEVAYEVHVRDAEPAFAALFEQPAARLPVIIGSFGPRAGAMELADCDALIDRAEQLGLPYLAWTFHMRCPPNLLEDVPGDDCGIGMPLRPTPWGAQLRRRLARAPSGSH